MDMGLATLGASALSGLANIGGGFMSAGGAAAQNQFAREQAQQAQDNFKWQQQINLHMFEENWRRQQYNSDTAYQRAMNDMRAAGLNPMLAYSRGPAGVPSPVGGSAASAPSQASLPTNPQGEIGRGLARGVSSALEAANTVQNVDLLNQRVKTEVDQQAKLKAETIRTAADTNKIIADTDVSKEMVKNPEVYRALMDAQGSAAKAAAGLSQMQTMATEQDARRKDQFGDSITGNNLNSVQQMLKHMYQQFNSAGGMSSVNRGADRLGDAGTSTAKGIYDSVRSMLGRSSPSSPPSRQSGYAPPRRKF